MLEQFWHQLLSSGGGRLVLLIVAAGLVLRFSWAWRWLRVLWRRGPHG